MKKLLSMAAVAGLLLFSACAHAQTPKNPEGPADPLNIVSAGKTHVFKVELADTPQESDMGLMYRASMPKDHGMIFDFSTRNDAVSMWMKNTLIPLDMLFIDNTGVIVAIAENARPGSLRLVGPGFPVASVLELNGGVVQELGLKTGDKVQHKLFKNLNGG
jgi:uncharacterized membrane protein (UPF0127 family)